MRKPLSLLIVLTLIFNIFSANCYAQKSNELEAPTQNKIESMQIDDMRWVWSEGDNAIIGCFYQDGTLSVCWTREGNNTKIIYQTLIPASLITEIPCVENDIIDLDYVVNNIEDLELQVSKIAEIDKDDISQDADFRRHNAMPTRSMGPNTLKENAVRKCISAKCDIGEYNYREIVKSYRYYPVAVAIYETKTFQINFCGRKQGLLKKGFDCAATATAIYSCWPGLPYASIVSYVSTALTFVSGKLPEDISLERYTGNIEYLRLAGHQGSNESYFTLCENIHEECGITYNVFIDYTVANSNTTDFADITNVVGEPQIDYLNSEKTFSENAIITRAYKDYQETH